MNRFGRIPAKEEVVGDVAPLPASPKRQAAGIAANEPGMSAGVTGTEGGGTGAPSPQDT